MKKIFSLLLCSAFLLGAKAQVTASTPDVLGLKETVYDFGKIPQGKPVTHIFEVVNNGTDSLRITNVQASCGCTTPQWEKDKVQAPGEKTNIVVGFNAATRGDFDKQIKIMYNGGAVKEITIKGQVWETPATSAPENNTKEGLQD